MTLWPEIQRRFYGLVLPCMGMGIKTSNGEAYGPGEGWMEGTQDNEAQHCMTHNAALCYC